MAVVVVVVVVYSCSAQLFFIIIKLSTMLGLGIIMKISLRLAILLFGTDAQNPQPQLLVTFTCMDDSKKYKIHEIILRASIASLIH